MASSERVIGSADALPDGSAGAPPGADVWQRATVAVNGAVRRYWRTGEGEPLVVLHGGGGVDLAPAYAGLADVQGAAGGRSVVCLELPGFGETVADPSLRTYRQIALDVLATLDALGFERFSLLGISFGGAVAAWLAAQVPARVWRLVLVAPAALRHGEKLPQLAAEAIPGALRAHPERGGPEPVEPERAVRQTALVGSVWSASDDLELRAALDGLDVVTLIVFGLLDGLIPAQTGRAYRRLLPRSTYALVYDAAHEVARDRPEAFVDLVGDFLERGDAHVVSRTSREINP